MKINRVEPIAVSFPMKKPVFMAGVEIRQADNILVRIEADNAVVGWGEAASAPTMTGETVEEHDGGGRLSRRRGRGPAGRGHRRGRRGDGHADVRQQCRQGGHRDGAARSGRPCDRTTGLRVARRQAEEPHGHPGRHQYRRARLRPARGRAQESRRLQRVQDQGRHRQAAGRRRADPSRLCHSRTRTR